ncbi:MAG: DUF2085 domain-containing protein [Chloroflexota bacterium]
MIAVRLYGRKDCHLCDEVQGLLEDLRAEYPHELEVVDIDQSEELQQKYGISIPVLEVGPYTLRAPISPSELKMTLGAAQDRVRQIDKLAELELEQISILGGTWTRADGFSLWLSNHYVAIINFFVVFYLGLAALAPVLMSYGMERPANLIYRAYGFVCHQLAFRSFFLFGEQIVYPRAAAHVEGLLTFNQATGMSEGSQAADIYAAAHFEGNEYVGYKIALCERDVAIYTGIFLFGIIFSLTGRRISTLPWYLWLALAIAPVGLDGFSQLLSQPPLSFLPFRESTPMLRTLTGGMFGFFTAWFGIPTVEESMAETRNIMSAKWRRVRNITASGAG